MFISFFMLTLMVVLVAWGLAEGILWRRPWLLLVLGLGLAVFSAFFKGLLTNLLEISALDQYRVDLKSALYTSEIVLASLSGGLIAASFVRKIENAHRYKVKELKHKIQLAKKRLEYWEGEDEKLKVTAKDMSNDEFWAKLDLIKFSITRSLIDIEVNQGKLDEIS